MDLLAQKAVQAALKGAWQEAKELNLKILKQKPKDIEALNRLGRAYSELGDYKKATATYKKVLKLDKYNPIAQKALEKLAKMKKNQNAQAASVPNQSGGLFIEEPGKTKTVSLIHLGDKSLITGLDVGDRVYLIPHAHRVSVQTKARKYIGRLPDDLSRRLIRLIRAGNEYECIVRSATPKQVRVFIKEVKRTASMKDIPSFPLQDKAKYTAFTPPELVREDKPDTEFVEEDNEED